MILDLLSSSPEDTIAIARALGELLGPGDVAALSGDLGAGKTVFCKGVGEALGIPGDRIVSPSFTIVTEHRGRVSLFHVDVYRLPSVREAEEIGIEEILYGEGVCIVEWAEKIETLLPKNSINVGFTISDEGKRRIRISAGDAARIQILRSRCQRFLPGGED